MSKSDLKIDWCDHKAAKYACEKWHYSKSVPVGKLVKVGAWEKGKYIGCVIFAWGMNKSLGSPYGLEMKECCELVRVAMQSHDCAVSRVLALSFKFLKKQSKGIRLIVSFADPEAGHHGGIYQAGGWIYSGQSAKGYEWRLNGKRLNKRAYTGHNFGNAKLDVPFGAKKIALEGKHRYLMPLDKEMRAKIAPLSKPYPKRDKQAITGFHPVSGGAAPTITLQTKAG